MRSLTFALVFIPVSQLLSAPPTVYVRGEGPGAARIVAMVRALVDSGGAARSVGEKTRASHILSLRVLYTGDEKNLLVGSWVAAGSRDRRAGRVDIPVEVPPDAGQILALLESLGLPQPPHHAAYLKSYRSIERKKPDGGLLAAALADPKHAKFGAGWLLLAGIHRLRKEYPAAGAALGKCAPLGVEPALVHEERGRQLMAGNKYQEARRAFREGIARDPSYLPNHYMLVGALHQDLEIEKAVAYLDEFLKTQRARHAHGAHFLLGRSHYILGDYETAVKHYARAVDCHPGFIDGRQHTAETYYFLGKFDESEKWLKSILERVPDHQQAHFFLGHIYSMKRKQYLEAIPHYEVYLRWGDARRARVNHNARPWLEWIRKKASQ